MQKHRKIDWRKYYRCLDRLSDAEILGGLERSIYSMLAAELAARDKGGVTPNWLQLSSDDVIAILEATPEARTRAALIRGGNMILQRLRLVRLLETREDFNQAGAEAMRELERFAENPLMTYNNRIVSGQMSLDESIVAHYLREEQVAELAKLYKKPENRHKTANEVMSGAGISLLSRGRLYLVVNALATDEQINKAVSNIVNQARKSYALEEGAVPSVGQKGRMLRTLEEVLAVFDWNLLTKHGMIACKFSEFAKEFTRDEEDGNNAARRMKSAYERNASKMLNHEYAVQMFRLGRP